MVMRLCPVGIRNQARRPELKFEGRRLAKCETGCIGAHQTLPGGRVTGWVGGGENNFTAIQRLWLLDSAPPSPKSKVAF